jgi:DNA-binding transcriptional LysR family regulator
MKLDLDGLEAFVVIAELSSFNRAAATLYISQSALSRRFKKMEEVTGVRLLERTTQRVELTQVGKAWLPLAQRLVMDLREAANKLGDAAHDWAGRASIACIPTAAAHFLPYAIAHYEKTHPSIQVRLLDSSSLGVIQAVADGSAEFGVGFFSRPETDLAFELLFDDPLVVVCHREHPLARRRSVTWRELAKHPVARVGLRSGTSLLMDITLERIGVKLKWFHEVEYHFSSALGLTEQGSVVTVLPRLAISGRGNPELVTRPLKDPAVFRQLGIVRRKDARLTPIAEGLIDALKQSAKCPSNWRN